MNEKIIRKLEFNKILAFLSNKAITKMGKEKCESLMPTSDFIVINKLQSQTEESLDMITKKGRLPLGGAKDIRNSIDKVLKDGTLNMTELLGIADTINAYNKVYKYAFDNRKSEVYESIDKYFEKIERVPKVESEILRCIINETEMADNASSRLLNIRQEIKAANNSIKSKLNAIINSNSKALQDSVVTMRNDRYCIPVRSEYKQSIKGIVHDQSATGSTFFIEPEAIININNKIAELKVKEKEEINKILRELTLLVLEHIAIIENNLNLIAELDFIFARGLLALDLGCNRPRINKDKYINIVKGRHPLLDVEEAVPINISIGDGYNSLIITGPNTGGKTVSLKTVGLLTLMAQSGLHIPASDESEISVFDEIYADIGDEQSIEQSLSTFSSHMVNIVDILKNVSSNSLVLFDELGAGTDPVEGAALAISILEKVKSVGSIVMATTHYSELKSYALTTDGVINASCEFNVDTLMPTYKILIGVPGKSNAFAISKRLGLKDEIIDAAKQNISKENIKFEDVITDLEISRKELETKQDKVDEYKSEIETLKEEIDKERNKLAEQREKLINEAKAEAKEILEKAKETSDKLIRELNKEAKEVKKSFNVRGLEKVRENLREEIKAKEIKKSNLDRNKYEDVTNVTKGEKVYVINLSKEAEVMTLPDNNGNFEVKIGIMKVKTNISDVARIKDNRKKSNKPKSTIKNKGQKVSVRAVDTEINVIGYNGLDAIEAIDKFIDRAYMSNMSTIRIVHGKGTGALRTQIHKYLKSHSQVKGFTLGGHYDGGSGATVVELK
ncbi:MAG: endonuclease MutS2 [Clostridia bacterium]|jgi:DNA mismatch repair protein MutS2|nr:endonuclease MutS2 [Clostridia bacterium]